HYDGHPKSVSFFKVKVKNENAALVATAGEPPWSAKSAKKRGHPERRLPESKDRSRCLVPDRSHGS
ncbi:MAG TPA: hypothetical protein VIX59_12320, partial [Candidatus Binataceae bacterium]